MLTSIPIHVRDDNGRYKLKRFWITDPTDVARMRPFSYESMIKGIRVVLTIAHLDHDETNHAVSDDRLMAMCQYCHLNYDASENYRRACEKSPQMQLTAVARRQETKL